MLNTKVKRKAYIRADSEDESRGSDSSCDMEDTLMLRFLTCFRDINDRKVFLVIVAAVLHFFSVTLTAISLKLLINKRIAGSPEQPNSESALVDTTNIFLHAFMSFLCGRYTSGMGDYVGRKVV